MKMARTRNSITGRYINTFFSKFNRLPIQRLAIMNTGMAARQVFNYWDNVRITQLRLQDGISFHLTATASEWRLPCKFTDTGGCRLILPRTERLAIVLYNNSVYFVGPIDIRRTWGDVGLSAERGRHGLQRHDHSYQRWKLMVLTVASGGVTEFVVGERAWHPGGCAPDNRLARGRFI
jgi:hypothetical protein